MFGVEVPATLHLCFVAFGPTVFDAATNIYAGVDVVPKITREGLIDLLVAVAASTSLGAWRAAIVV